MNRQLIRGLWLAALVCAACASAGCGLPELLVYPWAPREATRHVAKEYDLSAERLLIFPYVGRDVLFEYPAAGLEVGSAVANQFWGTQPHEKLNLRGRVQRMVNPQQVALYQQQNLEWPNKSVAAIGREFDVDKVLYIEVYRFTMMEEGSANLYRGRISGRIQVVDSKSAPGAAPLYEAEIAVRVPEDRPMGTTELSEEQLRAAAVFRFAEEILYRFVDHDEKVVKTQ